MGDKRRDSGEYYPGGRVIARPGTAPQQVVVQWNDVQGKPQIAPLPERYRESDMKGKINEIASKFATLAMVALIGWSACADVTVQKKRKDEIFNDEMVVVDVSGSGGGVDTNAVERIANAAVETNAVTRALVSATNDLTTAVGGKRDKTDLDVYETVFSQFTWTSDDDDLIEALGNKQPTFGGGMWFPPMSSPYESASLEEKSEDSTDLNFKFVLLDGDVEIKMSRATATRTKSTSTSKLAHTSATHGLAKLGTNGVLTAATEADVPGLDSKLDVTGGVMRVNHVIGTSNTRTILRIQDKGGDDSIVFRSKDAGIEPSEIELNANSAAPSPKIILHDSLYGEEYGRAEITIGDLNVRETIEGMHTVSGALTTNASGVVERGFDVNGSVSVVSSGIDGGITMTGPRNGAEGASIVMSASSAAPASPKLVIEDSAYRGQQIFSQAEITIGSDTNVVHVRSDIVGMKSTVGDLAESVRETSALASQAYDLADSANTTVTSNDSKIAGFDVRINAAQETAEAAYSLADLIDVSLHAVARSGLYTDLEGTPTISEWALLPTKPEYTADEVGAYSLQQGYSLASRVDDVELLKRDLTNNVCLKTELTRWVASDVPDGVSLRDQPEYEEVEGGKCWLTWYETDGVNRFYSYVDYPPVGEFQLIEIGEPYRIFTATRSFVCVSNELFVTRSFVTNAIATLATAPGNYAAVSNAAINAVQKSSPHFALVNGEWHIIIETEVE